MVWLRRAWLWAIGATLVIGGGGALVMRLELLTPEPTLSPELYGHALGLHEFVLAGVLLAALLAIPTLVMKPGRGSVVLGFLALGLWTAAIAFFVVLDLSGSLAWPGFSQRGVLLTLAASLGLGAAQLAVAIPANVDQPPLVTAIGGLAAIAIVGIPLAGGKFPVHFELLLATTAVAGGTIYDATSRGALWFAIVATVPCLVLAWAATAAVHVVDTSYFHDTVGMVSPLPLTGGALVGALVLAATRLRSPHRRLAQVAGALITVGVSVVSLGFLVLGTRGLPRRYFAYLPEYQVLQVIVGAAAVLAVLGGAMVLEAFRRGARTSASRA